MQNKIQQMESKLITGGKDIITHTSEQEQILRQKRFGADLTDDSFFKDLEFTIRRMIAEAERRHREVQQQLAQGEEERASVHEKYASIKEEVEDKRMKREKLSKQMKKLEGKKSDLLENHRAAREELEAEQREIQKQAKLLQLIALNFIPPDERERLFRRMQFDEQHHAWTLKELSKQT